MAQRIFPSTARDAAHRAGRLARTVAALLIAGLWPRREFEAVEQDLGQAPLREQAVVVGTVIGLLAAGAFFAAQFGLIGLGVYWMAVILIAR